MNIWGTRNTLIYVVFQGPIVTYHKIVEPWRALLFQIFCILSLIDCPLLNILSAAVSDIPSAK